MPIREKGQRSTSVWFARKSYSRACVTFHIQLQHWTTDIYDFSILWRLNLNNYLIHNVMSSVFFLQQRRTPAQRSCWGSCRRRGPVRCAWTNWCPSSSSPVVIWWCVVTALPACVTAPSAELSLEAVFALSCPKAKVRSHCYTGVACVALSSSVLSFPLNWWKIKILILLVDFFCQSIQITLYNKHFKLFNMLILNGFAVHFTKSRYDNKLIKRAHSFINKHLFTWSHSTVLDK